MTTILTTITWQGKTGYFLDPGNWSLGVIPGTGDTALFGASGVTDISIVSPSIPSPFSAPFLVGAEDWSFSPVASNYNFGIGFKVTLEFDHGAITVTGGSAHLFNFGELDFDFSSSGQAPITNFNLLGFAGPGSTAGNSIIDTVGGARTAFATLSTGGSAQFITEAGGVVDFSLTSGPGDDGRITAGSIAGAGTYKLGFNHLIVGSNGLSTTVSGPIDDGGAGSGSGGSLDKVGRGTLTLSGAGNTYSGGTKLEAGTLDVAAVGAAGTGAIGFAGKATLKLENAALSGNVFATNILFLPSTMCWILLS
jgi:autotransporter-associated beta strand protein